MWQELWRWAIRVSPYFVIALPIVISFVALFVALQDRRPKLILKARKGDWYKLEVSSDRNLSFGGVLEIYNLSGRSNAVRDYQFWCKKEGGEWEPMQSEMFGESSGGEDQGSSNPTPLALPPYSGAEVRVRAYRAMPRETEVQINIQVEDLFGKTYEVEVKATRGG